MNKWASFVRKGKVAEKLFAQRHLSDIKWANSEQDKCEHWDMEGSINGKTSKFDVKEMKKIGNIILPFPGEIVRSGSKVGSKYKNLIASTNDAYCPTLKGITKTNLDKDIECVLEIVVDGINEKDIALAMKKGISIICKKFNKGIKSISAGNYGGKLGPFHFHLRDIMK